MSYTKEEKWLRLKAFLVGLQMKEHSSIHLTDSILLHCSSMLLPHMMPHFSLQAYMGDNRIPRHFIATDDYEQFHDLLFALRPEWFSADKADKRTEGGC